MINLMYFAAILLLAYLMGKEFRRSNELAKQLMESEVSLEKSRNLFNKTLDERTNLSTDNFNLKRQLDAEIAKNSEILSQKKSSETRLGIISENLVPLLNGLPYDPKNMHHLGQPIDYIYFNYTGAEGVEIVFIECKSGNSQESKRQKLIKSAIRLGKIYYEELRIDEKGVKIKRAKNV